MLNPELLSLIAWGRYGTLENGAEKLDTAKQSYSQCGEDLIVRFAFDVMGVEKPSYLDIGAFHPYVHSNTALFHRNGSRGINIDANPEAVEAFRVARPEDITLNIGCAKEKGTLQYYNLSEPWLNSFSKDAVDLAVTESNGRVRLESTLDIDVLPVADVLNDHGGTCPEFLSLDVEGFDFEILSTLDSWPDRPVVISVETMTYSETGTGVKATPIIDLLQDKGYVVLADTFLNTVFARRDRWIR